MFGMNKLFGADEIKITNSVSEAAEVALNPNFAGARDQAEFKAEIDRRRRAAIESLNQRESKPARPGDTPARAFVGKTHDQIEATLNTYEDELAALNRDVAKLEDERAQITRSINALRAAMNYLNNTTTAEEDKALYDSAVSSLSDELSDARRAV